MPTDTKVGQLGIELASWMPPPLVANHPFVYYLGRKGAELELECSCLLQEHVEWTTAGPIVHSDQLYPDDAPCPFDVLRAFCAEATKGAGLATIVCDDSGGQKQDCTVDDYGEALLRLEDIARGKLLFAEVSGSITWRVLHIVNAKHEKRETP